jgi:tagatose 6-phosphate kinase
VPIIIDTSGATLRKIINKRPFMVKPNCDEAKQLTGKYPNSTNDIKEFLGFLKEKGVTIPFVSLGKNGSAVMIENKFYQFKVPTVMVINSVGSGDSTVAGIAVGISRNLPIIDAIRLGMATGVANTQFQQTGFVTTNLAQNFYKQIEVVEL